MLFVAIVASLTVVVFPLYMCNTRTSSDDLVDKIYSCSQSDGIRRRLHAKAISCLVGLSVLNVVIHLRKTTVELKTAVRENGPSRRIE